MCMCVGGSVWKILSVKNWQWELGHSELCRSDTQCVICSPLKIEGPS